MADSIVVCLQDLAVLRIRMAHGRHNSMIDQTAGKLHGSRQFRCQGPSGDRAFSVKDKLFVLLPPGITDVSLVNRSLLLRIQIRSLHMKTRQFRAVRHNTPGGSKPINTVKNLLPSGGQGGGKQRGGTVLQMGSCRCYYRLCGAVHKVAASGTMTMYFHKPRG